MARVLSSGVSYSTSEAKSFVSTSRRSRMSSYPPGVIMIGARLIEFGIARFTFAPDASVALGVGVGVAAF